MSKKKIAQPPAHRNTRAEEVAHVDARIVAAVRDYMAIGGEVFGTVSGIHHQVRAAIDAIDNTDHGGHQGMAILNAVSLQLQLLSLVVSDIERARELEKFAAQKGLSRVS